MAPTARRPRHWQKLEAFSGTQFDPRIVRLFVAEYREHGDQIK
jgi:hypothetical protein